MNSLVNEGEIWYAPIVVKPLGLIYNHFFVFGFSKGLKYRDCDTIVEMLMLETGEKYRMYLDTLEADGIKIDSTDYRRNMGL
jgi:hypothetical protein